MTTTATCQRPSSLGTGEYPTSQVKDPGEGDILFALRSLVRRHRDLTEEISVLEARMRARATAANPALLASRGVGPMVGAQLLITAGDNPDRLRS